MSRTERSFTIRKYMGRYFLCMNGRRLPNKAHPGFDSVKKVIDYKNKVTKPLELKER